ncbi:MAG: GntR family transcriptional regulator [Desulfobacterales bacterium]|nr:GntR family transcriptional regulator [Desulfobacterales bacterium]
MELDDIKIERSTTVDRVVEALRRALFDRKIKPGEQLREMMLAKNFSVSRSTVREALRVLTANGLTVYSPNKGVTARRLTPEEIDDIFLTRKVLETAAVNARPACRPRHLDELASAMEDYEAAAASGDTLATADAHIRFHSTLVGFTGSRRLMDTERAVMNDLQLVIASIDKKRDDLDREIEKHQTLTRLLIDGNHAEALKWICDDLELAKGFVLKQITG